MTDARAWLDAHAADVPPSLLAQLADAVAATGGAAAPAAAADADALHDMLVAADADALHTVLAAADADALHAVLAAAGITCLHAALQHCDDRGAALHLLAADALVTHACSAAAQTSVAALAALCDELTTTRLSMLIPDHGA